MPFETRWVDPDVAVRHAGRKVFHTYKSNDVEQGARSFWYTTNEQCGEDDSDCEHECCPHVFDIRQFYPAEANDLAYESEKLAALVRRAIDEGKLHFDEEPIPEGEEPAERFEDDIDAANKTIGTDTVLIRELLAALEELHDACEHWQDQNDPVLKAARELIAKCEGRVE